MDIIILVERGCVVGVFKENNNIPLRYRIIDNDVILEEEIDKVSDIYEPDGFIENIFDNKEKVLEWKTNNSL